MGQGYGAICSECGTRYTANIGGGFAFHLLHCDSCGTEKDIAFEELGDVHRRYIKGLDVPYSMASRDHDLEIQRTFKGEPLDAEAYHAAVEEHAGGCECGGRFNFDAPPRCPECGSDSHEQDPGADMICFD